MELTITLKDVKYEELLSASEHIYNDYYEPHYRTCIGDIDYNIEVEPTTDDYIEFFLENADSNIIFAKNEREALERFFNDKYIKNCIESALDYLEFEDDFIDFMKERYYYKALKKYNEER